MWAIQVTDPSAKGKNTGQVVKMAVDVQPVPPEAIPGTPFRPAIFEGMSAMPYVRDGWVSYTLWAKDMRSALPTPTTRTAEASSGHSPNTPTPARSTTSSGPAGKAAAA